MSSIVSRFVVLSLLTLTPSLASARPKELRTNCCQVQEPPTWLTKDLLQNTAKRLEGRLQWTIRRVQLKFVSNPTTYQSQGSLQFPTRAFFKSRDNTIYFGPTVHEGNFSEIFGHELVHVVFAQKHKTAIPTWLEEGLANYIGSESTPNYVWLNQQTLPAVTTLAHPNSDPERFRLHYQLSGAAVELIASRCSLDDLLMLSVRRSVPDFLEKVCRIKNINQEVDDWIKSKRPTETHAPNPAP